MIYYPVIIEPSFEMEAKVLFPEEISYWAIFRMRSLL
jgi:hypothetical protein